jgi:hypothetical protein
MGEVIVLNEIRPSWNVHSTFLKFHRTAALELDALRHSHSVQMVCVNDSEDAITQSLCVARSLRSERPFTQCSSLATPSPTRRDRQC